MIHKFLDVSEFILNHAEKGLESWWLLLPQKRLNGSREEIRVTGNDKPFKQILCHLVRDALVLRGNVGRVSSQRAHEDVFAVFLKDHISLPNLIIRSTHA